MTELREKNVLIIGMGKTGLASARFLAGRCRSLSITDEKPVEVLKDARRHLQELHLTVGRYDTGILEGIDLIIPSPGVPPSSSLLSEAIKKNIMIWSEIELAFRFLKTPMIAITGTNGKTTTTTLVGEMLNAWGKKVFVGGNIGSPLIGYVGGEQNADFAVVEVSSFQLQFIDRFHPAISILLNTTCDHVDYHGSFDAYRRAKERIFENQTEGDFAILNRDEDYTEDLSERIKAHVRFFSSTQRVTNGMFLDSDRIVDADPSRDSESYPLSMIQIPGRHNVENVMAAIMAARGLGCSREVIFSAVRGFKGVSHRIEFAGERKGVRFYDDSKGTNVGAVVRALETFTSPLVLLLGGRDKDGDFETLIPLIREKVIELVLFGEARDLIGARIGGVVKTSQAVTLKEAVKLAFGHSLPGHVVLLSPGCASFDEFSDYKERGRFFKETVERLDDE